MTLFSMGPLRSMASMRARYFSASERAVNLPEASADWRSPIVVSSSSNAGTAEDGDTGESSRAVARAGSRAALACRKRRRAGPVADMFFDMQGLLAGARIIGDWGRKRSEHRAAQCESRRAYAEGCSRFEVRSVQTKLRAWRRTRPTYWLKLLQSLVPTHWTVVRIVLEKSARRFCDATS